MEFKEPSLISFAKLLQSEIEDFGNIDSLPDDAKLFLTKAKKWIEESSEIEVLPPPVSGYAILFRGANIYLSGRNTCLWIYFISQMKFSRFRVDFCKESNLKSKYLNYFARSQTSNFKILKI